MSFDPTEFFGTGTKFVEAAMDTQAKFFKTMQEVNQEWLDRAQAEASLAAEFMNKMTASRSAPDVTAACQEWAGRRMQMVAEDSQRLVSDSQKFMEAGAKIFGNGLSGGST
jgi:hypothetical protein